MVDFDLIIEKYIAKSSPLYEIYYTHVSLVADYAVEIAGNMDLDEDSVRFIRESGMLHDIGIVEVDHPGINCCGKLPYIQHLIVGKRILDEEGLPKHADVAMRHCSPNLTVDYVKENEVRLPEGDYTPQNQAERIIAFADLFYTKSDCVVKMSKKRSFDEVLVEVEGYKPGTADIVIDWAKELKVV